MIYLLINPNHTDDDSIGKTSDTSTFIMLKGNSNERRDPSANYLHIEVLNPEIHGLGHKRFTNYEIRVRVSGRENETHTIVFYGRPICQFFVIQTLPFVVDIPILIGFEKNWNVIQKYGEFFRLNEEYSL